ncbi:MAG: hypothetical protein QMC67_08525 [Candidatus Wallbacteria bacterium]
MIEILKSLFYGYFIFNFITIYVFVILICNENLLSNMHNNIIFLISIFIGYISIEFNKLNSIKNKIINKIKSNFQKINLFAMYLFFYFIIFSLIAFALDHLSETCKFSNKLIIIIGLILGFKINVFHKIMNFNISNFINYLVCIFSIWLSYKLHIYENNISIWGENGIVFGKVILYYVIMAILINIFYFFKNIIDKKIY